MVGVRLIDQKSLLGFQKVSMNTFRRLLSKHAETHWMLIQPLTNVADQNMDFPRARDIHFQHLPSVILQLLKLSAEIAKEIVVVRVQLDAKTS